MHLLHLTLALATALLGGAPPAAAQRPAPQRPNIVFILADDLGWGDLGSYGQRRVQTPNLDRMAREGMRFTDFYAGSTVCAPSRSVLMTGLHTGHTRVRGNGGAEMQQLRAEDVTVAEVLRERGYATGLVGKWGLGEVGSPGHPNRQGFQHFFGYLNQSHAHNFYPEFLWRGTERVPLRNVVVPSPRHPAGLGTGVATRRLDYSHDLFAEEALRFIDEHRAEPFFLYLALTIPHANNEADHPGAPAPPEVGMEVPDFGRYAGEPWPATQRGFAAMVSRMDRDVGRVLDRLRELGVDDNTLVIFTSDNGPHREGGNDPSFFDSNGPFRGIKRDLYEGGIRVPALAWWPGTVPAGAVSDHVAYFGDFLATAAELAGAEAPRATDGISLVPVLTGHPERQRAHPYLYWEFYEQGSAQAVRMGRYKGVRKPMLTGPIELYDLESDPGERRDLAAAHPELVERIAAAMRAEHTPDPAWQPRGTPRTATAFPGAAGWAASTPGGRGGQIVRVTTLAPSGPGSLAEALATRGPRIVVFEVGGVIDLAGTTLQITEPWVTVAGQTAPSPGITLIRGGLRIETHDVVLRHLRVRPGEAGNAKRSGWEVDGIATSGPDARDIIVDHCSATWSTDENLSASGPRFGADGSGDVRAWREGTSRRITFSNNIIAEGLSNSTHAKGEHSKGTLVHDNVTDILILGNLFASNMERNPLLKGGARGVVANNVIFNPGRRAVHYNLLASEWGEHPFQEGAMAVVNNVVIPGPDTPAGMPLVTLRGEGPLQLFARGNLGMDGVAAPSGTEVRAEARLLDAAPLWPEGLEPLPAERVVERVLADVGARPWDRDAIDQRIVRGVTTGTGRIIHSEAEVGGYPAHPETRRPFNPDEWDLDTMTRREPAR